MPLFSPLGNVLSPFNEFFDRSRYDLIGRNAPVGGQRCELLVQFLRDLDFQFYAITPSEPHNGAVLLLFLCQFFLGQLTDTVFAGNDTE